jgi:TPR repeat protein
VSEEVTALESAAAAGDLNAMFSLGMLLEDSDSETARRWYEEAAAAGHTDAMNNLGMLVDDDGAAQRWWEQAAAAGHADAMFNLGELLEYSDPSTACR